MNRERMLAEKFKKVRLLLLDVDGVLTAGEIIYGSSGEELKIFNSKDGLGIRLVQEAGIRVGIVTARSSDALKRRCQNLRVDLLFDDIMDKASVLPDVEARTGCTPEEIAYMGDDLLDIPIMERVGLSIAVADAVEVVRTRADLVTEASGGKGAVREVCDLILHHKKLWSKVEHIFSEKSSRQK